MFYKLLGQDNNVDTRSHLRRMHAIKINCTLESIGCAMIHWICSKKAMAPEEPERARANSRPGGKLANGRKVLFATITLTAVQGPAATHTIISLYTVLL